MICILVIQVFVASKIINFEDAGAIPFNPTLATAWKNGGLMNTTLAQLLPGDIFIIPNRTFHIMGGIKAKNLTHVIILIEGTLIYSDNMDEWPRDANRRVFECMYFEKLNNVTFTSTGKGLINGKGGKWWGIPGIGYLVHGENRPRLLHIAHSQNILVENLILKDSPYWTFLADHVDGLEIRWTDISARRTDLDHHDIIDLTAFNTDGFDVTGKNVWIHDCNIWNQDDTIAVKDGSENMLFERINASGIGLTIGSISGSVVRNITFRDCYMHNTMKGIYLKFRAGNSPGSISDVTFENIVIDNASQWAIWIGPAQQSDSDNLCAAHPCSICWPEVPDTHCYLPAAGSYANITLRNITINNPQGSPGVIMANATNPMVNVVFDNVKVNNPGTKPWGDQYYACKGVKNGIATGDTWPVPPCFQDKTTNRKSNNHSIINE